MERPNRGKVKRGYIFYCFLCPHEETIFAGDLARAEHYMRQKEGWTKKARDGWHCPRCK